MKTLSLGQADAVAAAPAAAPCGAEALAQAIRTDARTRIPPALDRVLERWNSGQLGELAAISEALDRALPSLREAHQDLGTQSSIGG